MSKGFDIPSNTHLGNSHDYWKAPQKNSKQIILQNMEWIKIERDRDGFATDECLDKICELHEQGNLIVVTDTRDDYLDYDFISPKHDIYEWRGDIERHTYYTHYLVLNFKEFVI